MLLQFNCALLALFCVVDCKEEWWQTVVKKQGPNVCVQEEILGENRYYAQPWANGNICGKPTVIRLLCCEGYSKVRGESGCSLVKPLVNLLETAKLFGAKQFVNYTKLSGLFSLLSKRGAFTIFAPVDEAFQLLSSDSLQLINVTTHSRERSSLLHYSIVANRLYEKDLAEHTKLTTLYRDRYLRINKHAGEIITVNCVPLVASNLEATNGIVHVTESVLLPPAYSTILEMFMRQPSLGTLAAIVVRTQLSELRSDGPFTIFAPIDQAWEALPQTFMETLMENMESVKVLLNYHIVKGIWCASTAAHESDITTLEGSTIHMTCNESGIYLNDAKLLQKDGVVGNGVVHLIDKVLIPEKVKFLNDVAESLGLTSFLHFATKSGLSSALTREGSYTVFAPTDEAFNALPDEQWEKLESNPVHGRHVLGYHLTSGRHLTSNFIDDQMIKPIIGSKRLRIKIQRKSVVVDGAMITSSDHEARNGILHVIDRVLLPTDFTLAEVLEAGNYSGFVSILNQTSPNMLNLLHNDTATLTLFSPDDEALNELPPGMIERLLEDKTLLHKIIGNHLVEGFVTVNGLKMRMYYQHKTVNGRVLTLRKEDAETITVGNLAVIKEHDIIARNGVIHRISRLIQF